MKISGFFSTAVFEDCNKIQTKKDNEKEKIEYKQN